MPYFIEEREGKYCVVKGTRESPEGTEKCHDTRQEALAHLKALYVNVEDAKALEPTANYVHGQGGILSDTRGGDNTKTCACPQCGHQIDVSKGTPCSEQKCPQCGSTMQGKEVEMKEVFKSYQTGDGGWRWLGISNVAVRDKEGETISVKAYNDAIDYAYTHGEFGELDLVHVDGTEIGNFDLMIRLDDRLIQGGCWYDSPLASKVRETISADSERWGLSIKFRYDPTQFINDVYEGGIRIFKVAALPKSMAASHGTAIAVTGGSDMAKSIDEETKAVLAQFLNEDEVAALVEKQKSLPDEENVKEKEGEPVAESTQSAVEPTEEKQAEELESDWLIDEKAQWTTAYINSLPNSAFLYVEPGEDGKRHLPYKNKEGQVDLPHLRNALSRLGQPATGSEGGESWLTDSLRKSLLAKARKILSQHGGEPSEDEDEGKSVVVPTTEKVSLFESIKAAVSEVFRQKETELTAQVELSTEPVSATPDVAENSKSAEAEVSEKVEAQSVSVEQPEAEKVVETVEQPEVATPQPDYLTAEAFKAYAEVWSKSVAELIAVEVAKVKAENESLRTELAETQKKLVELAKPIEQRVMDRLNELPPIVKVRTSDIDATTNLMEKAVQERVKSQTGLLMDDIAKMVERKIGETDKYTV